MRLEFVGGESGNTGSPRVSKTDRDTLVIQGYKVEDPEALADANTPAHETLVEIPYSLLQYLPRTHPAVANLPDFDYWLFDSSRLFVLHFADDDLIGAEPTDAVPGRSESADRGDRPSAGE